MNEPVELVEQQSHIGKTAEFRYAGLARYDTQPEHTGWTSTSHQA